MFPSLSTASDGLMSSGIIAKTTFIRSPPEWPAPATNAPVLAVDFCLGAEEVVAQRGGTNTAGKSVAEVAPYALKNTKVTKCVFMRLV